ncbi:C-type lectin domain family 2 member A-like [Ranitomeya variabilis]|uniref:C-type lectin domain family 2 member A-like n=1 Tax=Ranitomeya variabilis TaxID=490064 RepID=UPI0040568078
MSVAVSDNDGLSEHEVMVGTGRSVFSKYIPQKRVTQSQKCKPESVAGWILLIILLVVMIIILTTVIIELTNTLIVARTLDDRKEIKNQKSAPCDDDWIWYLGKCYYFSTARDTWRNSEKFCKTHKSSLAIIENKEELEFLLRFRGSENQWIGIKRTYAGTGWMWTNGTSYDGSLFNITRLSDKSGTDEYAFLNHDGVKSQEGVYTHNWICNRK